jgi:3-hydroxyacyl-[acyl-carrier-protein] dehydratase
MSNIYKINREQVLKFLPHRDPFLHVDEILEIHPVGDLKDRSLATKAGVKVVALKKVRATENWVPGHFPGFPIMPGVLIIEAMAQTAAFSMYPYVCDDLDGWIKQFQCILVGVDKARFRKPVFPGNDLRLESTASKIRGKLWMFECSAFVDGQRVADAEIMANMILTDPNFNGGKA